MSDDQWFMAISGHQVGPVSRDDVVTNLRNGTIDGNTLVFGPGLTNWTPLKDVPQLASYMTGASSARTAAPPPIVPGRHAHEIDFRIVGSEMQFVEVELDPGESAVAEAGSMMYMTNGISMETVFGDGAQQRGGGVMNAILGAGKRLITGESLFMTVFTNSGGGKQQVSFAAPYPGKILAMDLKQFGGTRSCQKGSFACAHAAYRSGARSSAASASGCSAVKDSSCRSSRATVSASCMRAGRSIRSTSIRGRRCASIPAAWWRYSPQW